MRSVESDVGGCCFNNQDCMSGFCSYGVCASNCAENDFFLQNRELGACCDYNSQCITEKCSSVNKVCVK